MYFIVFLIIISFLLIYFATPKYKGQMQEKQIANELMEILPDNCKVYRNLFIPKPNGEYTEIDLLILSYKGIIVIESKNYSGWIFGNEKSNKWTSIIYREKSFFYNPIMQNKGHIKWLREYIKFYIPTYSLIVFSNRCTLKDITIVSNNVKVIYREELQFAINEIFKNCENQVCQDAYDKIDISLKKLENADKEIVKNHVKKIRYKYR